MSKESELRSLYGDILSDHHESPRNYGAIANPSLSEKGYNPLCGDQVCLSLKLNSDETKIEQCHFEGEGCSICMASTSMMTEKVTGMTKQQALEWIEAFRNKMQGTDQVALLPADDSDDDLVSLYGVKRFPVRIKCALLPWTTLKNALLKNTLNQSQTDTGSTS
jgi:nitrogen fixation NifU-like protein